MAANTTMTVQMRSFVTGETVSASLTYLNPALFPQSGETPEAVYTAVDAVGRKISGLTQNSYIDTIISRTESVTEILNA